MKHLKKAMQEVLDSWYSLNLPAAFKALKLTFKTAIVNNELTPSEVAGWAQAIKTIKEGHFS